MFLKEGEFHEIGFTDLNSVLFFRSPRVLGGGSGNQSDRVVMNPSAKRFYHGRDTALPMLLLRLCTVKLSFSTPDRKKEDL